MFDPHWTDDDTDLRSKSFIGSHLIKLWSLLRTSQGNIFQCEDVINQIASFDEDLKNKCETTAVINLLPQNSNLAVAGNLKVICLGVDSLVKYGRNLLKPTKNPNWRSIKLSNVVFRTRVQPLKGCEHVLRELGYTEQNEASFDFLPSLQQPNLDKVAVVTADLLILQRELHQFLNQTHVNKERFWKCFSITDLPGVLSTKTIDGITSESIPKQQNYQQKKDCVMCEGKSGIIHCENCQSARCEACDRRWHSHPKRKDHQRRLKDDFLPDPFITGVKLKTSSPFTADPQDPLVSELSGAKPKTSSPVKAKPETKKTRILPPPTREEILQNQHEEVVMKDVEVLEQIEVVSKRCKETMDWVLGQQLMHEEMLLRNRHLHLMNELAEIDEELAKITIEEQGEIQTRGAGRGEENIYKSPSPTMATTREDRPCTSQEGQMRDNIRQNASQRPRPLEEIQDDGHMLEDIQTAWDNVEHQGGDTMTLRELRGIALDITKEFNRMYNIENTYRDPDVVSQGEIHEAWLRNGCNRKSTTTECLEMLYGKVEELHAAYQHLEKINVAYALMVNGFNLHQARHSLDKQNSQKDARKGQEWRVKVSHEATSAFMVKVMEEIERSQLEKCEKREKIRKILMAEHGLTLAAVDTVFALREGHDLSECIEAVKAVGDQLQQAQDYFKRCDTCFTYFGMHKLVVLPMCQCLVCTECFTQYFTLLAKTTSCMYKFSCPVCNQPDLENSDQESYQFYFSLLGTLLKSYLEEEDYELYEQKLATWSLMADPNFRWCVHGCSSGFINERRWEKVQCPECHRYQCFYCKKPWLDQHKNVSCEEFDAWKKNNDPEFQQQGLAAHLKEHGINCPKCKMRYELAKGGCMHFKCPQCHHQFCCGCNLPFLCYPACQQLPSCKNKGLHAHHPRDCFYYLRDEDCHVLQQLLQKHKIDYNPATNAAAGNRETSQVCPVKEQQETPNGLMDGVCGKTLKGQCGLCENHYKEYLVGLINKHNIDPVDIFGVESLQATLRRNDRKIPNRVGNEAEAAYYVRLRQEIEQQLPLRSRNAQAVQGVSLAAYQIY